MVNTSIIEAQALLARQQLLNQRQHKRLARKIHDEISQKMTLLSLQLSLASTDESPPANWAGNCKDWASLVTDLGQSIRDIVNELQPRIIDTSGLPSALRWFAQSASRNIACAFIAPGDGFSLAPFASNELFGICREIVMDILVPAGANRVEIKLEQKEGMAHLHLRAGKDGSTAELISQQALDAISVGERLNCLEGTVELGQSSTGDSSIILSIPSNCA